VPFCGNGCCSTMSGDDFCFVGEGHEAIFEGGHNLAEVASGEVSAADAAGKEGVSGEQEVLAGKVKRDAALGMAGGMEDDAMDVSDGDFGAFLGAGVWRGDGRCGHT